MSDYPNVERPTEPGWYWCRLADDEAFQVVRVWSNLETASMVGIEDDDDLNAVGHFTDWRGPIPEPTDP